MVCYDREQNLRQNCMKSLMKLTEVTKLMLSQMLHGLQTLDMHSNIAVNAYLTISLTISTFNDLWNKYHFENIMGKRENAVNQHFLLFQ